MDFEAYLKRIEPKLRQLACKFRSYNPFMDEDDLLNEMRNFLFERWTEGTVIGNTESYVVQSCYFHLMNFLRKSRDNARIVSIDGPVEPENTGRDSRSFEELTVFEGPDVADEHQGRALYDKIMNNGLSRFEKDIIGFLYDGYTVREIGGRMSISHAMVIKHKKAIEKKILEKYGRMILDAGLKI